jgi:hypothetical protein
MSAIEWAYENHLIRAADGVLEQFARLTVGSHRIPIAWVAAQLEPSKHDQVRVQIGAASNPGAAFYSAPAYVKDAFTFEIPSSEEARLRAFLDGIRAASGRS